MPRPRRIVLQRALVALLALLVLVAIGLIVRSFLADAGKPKKHTTHQIAIVRPPPPPPPPKPEVKPPEMKKQEVKIPEPEAKPDQPPTPDKPPGERLGLDAEGTGSGDAFGLQANKGGRDITSIGGGGGSRAQYAWYTSLIKRHFDEELQKDRKLRNLDYRAIVRVWLAKDGSISRVEIAGSSGDAQTDEALKVAFHGMRPLREPPPESMPQPVRLRITARGAG